MIVRRPGLTDTKRQVRRQVPLTPGMPEAEAAARNSRFEVTFDQGADLTNSRVALRLDAEARLTGVRLEVPVIAATDGHGCR